MASINERERATPMGKRFEVRWRGPDFNDRGLPKTWQPASSSLREHMKSFATRPEAEEFLAALPPVQQVPARCDCDPARWIVIDAAALSKGEITCSICGQSFTPIEATA
jgi:hypothetical protein